jgi:methylenetetrahydrofolate dehydrogenase (NADP+)/methenyltetrahydrofolate cyclohydrolase
MTTILSGIPARDAIAVDLKQRIVALSKPPVLGVILVGDRADSTAYVGAKKKFGERIGVEVQVHQFPETVDEKTLREEIARLNADSSVTGIIVQLPVPQGISGSALCNAIDPAKDVDGLSATNIKKLVAGEKGIVPATARGVLNLLAHYNIDPAGKKVTVVGRSLLVGKPIALSLLACDATVTVCHSKTTDTASITRDADILIVATGKPGLIGTAHVRAGQVVIDVGINTVSGSLAEEVGKRKLVGDVDFEAVKDCVSAISPVPGGVGPTTVSALFQNVVEVAEQGSVAR